MSQLFQYLTAFGARKDDYISLEQANDHRVLRYVDLLGKNQSSALIEAVVESQSQPLLYVVTAGRLSEKGNINSNAIAELRRMLAMRGEPACLGILWPGKLDIYSTDLKPDESSRSVEFHRNKSNSISLIPRLASGEDIVQPAELQLRQVLFGLMTDAGIELKELGLSVSESIALVGRALFFRFLVGKRIISKEHIGSITSHADSLESCFGNENALAETNYWLDQKFNGDLLHLPTDNYIVYFRELYKKHGDSICRPLSAILGLDDPIAPGASQGRLQMGWSDLDFDHIPVGLLSETYEELMRQFDAIGRHETSVYYTPNHIAEYMVAEALHLNPQGSRARVLDPACGAGVFLTAAFRKLAQLRFEETGRRPSRSELRSILNTQLVGFDINSHARMLGALGLYLTALELDPHPAPIEALIFDKLEGSVFIDVADPDTKSDELGMMSGSIGKHVPDTYRHSFDLVIGNPPWTALKGERRKLNKVFTKRCREIAKSKGLLGIAKSYDNPDNVPDLPFLWCAMDWAKENGRICFAVAGRLLFKRIGNGLLARQALFKALSITGILNGAALRNTKIWPNISQPFCLLFADNRIPTLDDQFVFLSPEEDPGLNEKGRMRIDATDAEAITVRQVIEQPFLFKTLFRGSSREADFIKRLTDRVKHTLVEYWTPENKLCIGQGFVVAKKNKDDRFLAGLPEITAHYDEHPFNVHTEILPQYEVQGLERPRDRKIYKGPLVLLRKATRPDRNEGQALFCKDDVAYQGSFYGFSAAEHKDGEFVTKYLLVLVHSALFTYYQLMTSGEFGIEREVIQVADVKDFPFVPPEELNQKQKEGFEIAAGLLINNQPNWHSLDEVVYDVYKVNKTERRMIEDSLETRAPFSRSIAQGVRSTDLADSKLFFHHLKESLNNVFSQVGVRVSIEPIEDSSGLPWKLFKISPENKADTNLSAIPSDWLTFADDYAVSRVTIADEINKTVIVGLLDRYRYWTPTQAKMLATDIIWQYGALLEGIDG
jgi:hypothetical protein